MIEAGIQPMKTSGSKSRGAPATGTAGSSGVRSGGTAAASPRTASGASMASTVVSETVVITGMALTTLALGTGLYLQAGVDAMGAMLIALGGYAAMLLMHAFVRQSVSKSRSSRRHRAGEAAADEAGFASSPEDDDYDDEEPTRSLFAEEDDDAGEEGTLVDSPRAKAAPAGESQAKSTIIPAAHSLPEGTGDPFGTLRPKVQPSLDASSMTPFGPAVLGDDVVTQPVIIASTGRSSGKAQVDASGAESEGRPEKRSKPSLGPSVTGKEAGAGASIVSGPPREADVEMIQSLIKKLADEVNAASTAEGAQGKPGVAEQRGRSSANAANYSGEDAPLFDAQGAIEQSVGALRSAAGSMRAAKPAGKAQPTDGGMRGQVIGRARGDARADSDGWRRDRVAEEHELAHASERASEGAGDVISAGPFEDARETVVHDRLNAITDALQSGRVDVLLDPILGISDGKARHFEVAVRLRDREENAIDLSGGLDDVAGTGVLPLLDRARLSRTSQLALRLESRGRNGALFSQFAGESLIADQFLDEFADAYRERENFAGQLVMTFSQADIRRLGPREWATLVDMADLGFRFAVSGVSDLDMDFEDLRARGFQFVKLDADVFLNGLPAAEITIPAGDICKHLAGVGMTLIVGEIEDEQVAAKVFGFGVLFGQGSLFGGPRLVKQAAVASDRDSSAAA